MSDLKTAIEELNNALTELIGGGTELLNELEGDRTCTSAAETSLEVLSKRVEALAMRVNTLETRQHVLERQAHDPSPLYGPIVREDTWGCQPSEDIRMAQYKAGKLSGGNPFAPAHEQYEAGLEADKLSAEQRMEDPEVSKHRQYKAGVAARQKIFNTQSED